MVLPAFAEIDDLIARRPGGVNDRDRPRALAALQDASALIRAEVLPRRYVTDEGELTDDVPEIFLSVTCASARRALDNPDGITSESLGGYSVSLANASGDVYLTTAEGKKVRQAAGLGGVWTQQTTRSADGTVGLDTAPVLCGPNGEQYLPVEPDGEPIIWGGPPGL